ERAMRAFNNLNPKRKAMILYVIVVLLTLFLVVGMCFVMMAESEATASRIHREATNYRDDYMTPQELLGYALGALVYDSADGIDPYSGDGQYNALRGHSLARNMFGWNYTANANGTLNGIGNNIAFNGS